MRVHAIIFVIFCMFKRISAKHTTFLRRRKNEKILCLVSEAYYRCDLYRPASRYPDRTFLADRFAPVLTVTSLLGGIYMNALNMMIFPLVFCSVVMGICSIGSIKTTGKITGASMVFFLCTTALASLAGLIIPRLIHLGEGVSFEMATSDIAATDMSNILDTIKNLIPSNPVSAFASRATCFRFLSLQLLSDLH